MRPPPDYSSLDDEDEFYRDFGRTLARWAAVERALCTWFQRVTKMRPEMASRVFFSARNFNGRSEMLDAAIEGSRLPHDDVAFVRAAIRKAAAYNSFRNSLAHGHPVRRFSRSQADQPRPGEWLLVDGQHRFSSDLPPGISRADLHMAGSNFGELAELIYEAYYHREFSEVTFRPPVKARICWKRACGTACLNG